MEFSPGFSLDVIYLKELTFKVNSVEKVKNRKYFGKIRKKVWFHADMAAFLGEVPIYFFRGSSKAQEAFLTTIKYHNRYRRSQY